MSAPVSSLLSRVIETAEAAINRPSLFDRDRIQVLQELLDEITAASTAPIDGARLISGHTVALVEHCLAVVALRSIGNDADMALFAQAAGVFLPRVRADLFRAVTAQRPAATADQDYSRKRT